jgi:hypothetical protein
LKTDSGPAQSGTNQITMDRPWSTRLRALGKQLLTITPSRLLGKRGSSNRRKKWALSYSSVLLQDCQSQLALKPSPSAFAEFVKHGCSYTARSVSASMGRRYGWRHPPRIGLSKMSALTGTTKVSSPVWVISGHCDKPAPCPLYPNNGHWTAP